MALNSLICADVLLRNCSLAQLLLHIPGIVVPQADSWSKVLFVPKC